MRTALMSVVALALVSTAVNANPIKVTSTPETAVHVSVTDLNLSSHADRSLLKSRIRTAAEILCSIEADRTADSAVGGRGCYRTAVANGLKQMNDIATQRAGKAVGRQ